MNNIIFIKHIQKIAKLSFNFNFNLVEIWDGFIYNLSNHSIPPTRKSKPNPYPEPHSPKLNPYLNPIPNLNLNLILNLNWTWTWNNFSRSLFFFSIVPSPLDLRGIGKGEDK